MQLNYKVVFVEDANAALSDAAHNGTLNSGPWQPRLKGRKRGRGEESATPPPPSFARSRGRKAS